MRFYLDVHLSPVIAEIARGLGLDVVSAADLGRYDASDDEHLRLAARDDRCLVTADRDFNDLTTVFLENGWPHAGVLIVPPSIPTNRFTRIAHAMLAYAQQHEGGSTSYLVDYLRRG